MSPRLMLALAALLIGLVIGQSPGGIHTAAASSSVDVFVSSFVDGGIYRVDSETGDTELVATLGFPAEDMVVDRNGILFVGGITTGVKRVDTNTNTILSDVGTNICGPEGLSIDSSGNVYTNTRLDPCDHSGVWRIDGGTAETAVQVDLAPENESRPNVSEEGFWIRERGYEEWPGNVTRQRRSSTS